MTLYHRHRVLKVELHAHTAQDPCDYVPHSVRDLIDRASALGYGALAITLHDRHYDPARRIGLAQARGLLLIQVIERTICRQARAANQFPAGIGGGCDLRRSPCPEAAVSPRTGDRAARLLPDRERDERHGAACRPHRRGRGEFRVHVLARFQRPRGAMGEGAGKPVVGNTDLHLLDQMGTTYTLVDVPDGADADTICEADRAGRVELRSSAPLFRSGGVDSRPGWSWPVGLAGSARAALDGGCSEAYLMITPKTPPIQASRGTHGAITAPPGRIRSHRPVEELQPRARQLTPSASGGLRVACHR